MPRARSIAPVKLPKVAEASRLSPSKNRWQDALEPIIEELNEVLVA